MLLGGMPLLRGGLEGYSGIDRFIRTVIVSASPGRLGLPVEVIIGQRLVA